MARNGCVHQCKRARISQHILNPLCLHASLLYPPGLPEGGRAGGGRVRGRDTALTHLEAPALPHEAHAVGVCWR